MTAALERGEDGVWGGTSERERRKLKKRGGSAGKCPACGGVFTWIDRTFGPGRRYCGRCLSYFDVLQRRVDLQDKAKDSARRRNGYRNGSG